MPSREMRVLYKNIYLYACRYVRKAYVIHRNIILYTWCTVFNIIIHFAPVRFVASGSITAVYAAHYIARRHAVTIASRYIKLARVASAASPSTTSRKIIDVPITFSLNIITRCTRINCPTYTAFLMLAYIFTSKV